MAPDTFTTRDAPAYKTPHVIKNPPMLRKATDTSVTTFRIFFTITAPAAELILSGNWPYSFRKDSHKEDFSQQFIITKLRSLSMLTRPEVQTVRSWSSCQDLTELPGTFDGYNK